MNDAVNRTLDTVGLRLKQLRLRRDVTLAGLADETGISTSTLSRLEAGLRRPTLEQLLPLARAYGVTLDELVDAPPTGNPRVNLRPIHCADGSIILPLTRRPGGIQAYKFVLSHPAATTPNPTSAPTRVSTGPTSSTAPSDSSSAITTSASNPARPRSSTRARRTGSAPPAPARSSSSA